MPLHFTCSWRSPQRLIGKSARVYLCVCVCALVNLSTRALHLMCVQPRQPYSGVRGCPWHVTGPEQSHSDHTAGSSIHRSISPSIHPCTKAHYRDDCLRCATSPSSTKVALLRTVCLWRHGVSWPQYETQIHIHTLTGTHSCAASSEACMKFPCFLPTEIFPLDYWGGIILLFVL